MIKQPASIFNDVIGPTMRGASSSHVAAAARIGILTRQMLNGSSFNRITVQFDINGSLATTFHGQGSDMGFAGGILGYMLWDEKLPNSLEAAIKEGISINFEVTEYNTKHPNTYRIIVFNDDKKQLSLDAVSTGGGMIEIQKIDELNVSISGDFFETIIVIDDIDNEMICNLINMIKKQNINYEFIDFSVDDNRGLINIKTCTNLNEFKIRKLKQLIAATKIIQLDPILPIMSSNKTHIPFTNAEEMLEIARNRNMELWELAVLYESERGNITKKEVYEKMRNIVLIIEKAIDVGLAGTVYKDRILGPQAYMIDIAQNKERLIPGDVINTIIKSITAIMEVKSSMGVIIAAPTAGAAGGLPGTIIGTANVLKLDIESKIKAMFAAGIIGIFISENSGFAAEVGGCQVECGAGSGMAAAGLVQLMGGSAKESVDAASMALQNILGMVCDPVGDRVEVPCLGKNIMAGVNAIACANMALSGFDKVIPFDETIIAMDKVGRMLPNELRCTGKGGLSITETSIGIHKKLNDIK